jgi:hypothetical protein
MVAQLIADLKNQLSGVFQEMIFLWHRTGMEDRSHFVHLQIFAIVPH